MAKYNEYEYYMTEEDKARARREDQSLWRFICGLLLTIPYGVIAFFDVWKMRDALPMLLIQLFPGVEDGNPTRLYTYISILFGGLMWFITILVLWYTISKPNTTLKKRLTTTVIWCAAAALVYALLHFMTTLVI